MTKKIVRCPVPAAARDLLPVDHPDNFDLPPFNDHEAVLALFDDEDLREWSSAWPWFDDDPDAILRQAIKDAERGSPAELIRLVKASLVRKKKKRGRGRPTGSVTPKSKRVEATPIHRAASMVASAEFFLNALYPNQSGANIHDRALLVVEYVWNDKDNVTVGSLATYLGRGPKDRHRV